MAIFYVAMLVNVIGATPGCGVSQCSAGNEGIGHIILTHFPIFAAS